MRSYPNINFSRFSIDEVCNFVADRMHLDIGGQLVNLQKAVYENDNIFKQIDQQHILPVLFVQLKDECEQLVRLESLVFFPFIRNKRNEPGFQISEQTKQKLFGCQELIMALYYRIKLSLKNFLSKDPYSPAEQIIINDLKNLEYLLSDWMYLVQNNIIDSVKNNTLKNEYTT